MARIQVGQRSKARSTARALLPASAQPFAWRWARQRSGQSPSTAMKEAPASTINRLESAARHL
ncbi:hypothetical protein WMF23_48540 [Sorangium sp. So ce542]